MILLTTGEVAERLRMKVTTIRSLIRSGDLPAIKIRSEYRIDEADLNQFVENKRILSEVRG